MQYVIQSAAPGEKIIHIGRFHSIYSIVAFLNILLGIVFAGVIYAGAIYIQTKTGVQFGSPARAGQGWTGLVMNLKWGFHVAAIGCVIFGFYKCLHMLVSQASTEIAVTTERIVYKRGIIARYVGEMNVERIEGVNVYQTILGRIFNFGTIVIHGLGVGQIILPSVMADPVKFRRAVEYAHTLKEDKNYDRAHA